MGIASKPIKFGARRPTPKTSTSLMRNKSLPYAELLSPKVKQPKRQTPHRMVLHPFQFMDRTNRMPSPYYPSAADIGALKANRTILETKPNKKTRARYVIIMQPVSLSPSGNLPFFSVPTKPIIRVKSGASSFRNSIDSVHLCAMTLWSGWRKPVRFLSEFSTTEWFFSNLWSRYRSAQIMVLMQKHTSFGLESTSAHIV